MHGGVDKAVYLYPSEHYSYWRTQLPDVELPWGAFGENFTSEGILEDQIKIGDRIRVGSAEFMVTQPRMPCFKLGIRFNRRVEVHNVRDRNPGFLFLGEFNRVAIFSAMPGSYPHSRKAGKTIFENAFGMPMLD